ncbi:MAG TPA: MBL fold metallo-hydrolase [Verrucomicrobiae bacterium]|nr:MBL fold metallo-hydrolase [Verrucomicrobiae bacterium]
MKLHVLGCGDAFGSGGRHQSGYLVEASDRLFLLDCGPTTLLAMKRAGLNPSDVDAIILSHLHGDHFGGIPFFFIEYLYRKPRDNPLTIAGPPGTEERVRGLFGLMYGNGQSVKEIPPTRFRVLKPEQQQSVNGIVVFPFRVPHQTHDTSLGLRVGYEGKQILFSGDSTWTDLFIDHARGVDLFLCECSFYSEQPGMHVNYLGLQANLSRLDCKKLVLTHMGEEMLARRHEVTATLAEDGMVIEI